MSRAARTPLSHAGPLVLAAALACHQAAPTPQETRSSRPPPLAVVATATAAPAAAPIRGEWKASLGQGPESVVVMPPLGATPPVPLLLGVHGAGDRPDWACGGWRLGSGVSALVACPQGSRLTPTTFAWASPRVLEERTLAALRAVRASYGSLVGSSAVFAGFSQGATYAHELLLHHAATFPIAILAEGAYRSTTDRHFAAAYRAAGGRRVALVCGTKACFQHARRAESVLGTAGLEVVIAGNDRAGHNLNEQMQRALREAWPSITAPLPPP